MDDIMKRGVFGKAVGYIHVIEFQKRGLPHAHILIKLNVDSVPRGPDDYDRMVCAEIPDPNACPLLYKTVTTTLMHGPCGNLLRNAPYMKDGKCSKRYPRQFSDQTTCDQSGYPVYRRRDQGRTAIRRGEELDNRWVVPYNPYLSQKYNCHINVEVCTTVSSVKYMYKYVYKGHDRTMVSIERAPDEGGNGTNTPQPVTDIGESRTNTVLHVDEIEQYLSGRYISAPEACWRLLGFKLQGKSHSVEQLTVHLEEQNTVTFNPNRETAQSIANKRHTMLTRFFDLCREGPNARELLYHEVPKHYTWDNKAKRWKPRQRGGHMKIGRMVAVSPIEMERYHLRLLLCYVKGPQSFADLRTVDGVVYEGFQAAAKALGLLEDDTEWFRCMEEAREFQMPRQLRHLFALLLGCCPIGDVRKLWDENVDLMSEDFQHRLEADATDDRVILLTLNDVDRHLTTHSKSLEAFPMLPQLHNFNDASEALDNENALIDMERGYNRDMLQGLVDQVPQLNHNQAEVYTKIVDAVMSEDSDTPH